MSVTTVLLDTNVFTAWLRPRSSLLPMYGKHVFGQRMAIAQQTVAKSATAPSPPAGASGDSKPWNAC